jgi:hypothetical protein
MLPSAHVYLRCADSCADWLSATALRCKVVIPLSGIILDLALGKVRYTLQADIV